METYQVLVYMAVTLTGLVMLVLDVEWNKNKALYYSVYITARLLGIASFLIGLWMLLESAELLEFIFSAV